MDDSPVTKIIFDAGEVKAALDEAVRRGLDDIWLLRGTAAVFITLPEQTFDRITYRVLPYLITKIRSPIFSQSDPPFVEIIPHHDCVLRKMLRMQASDCRNLRLEFHFSTLSEYRLYLTRSGNA